MPIIKVSIIPMTTWIDRTYSDFNALTIYRLIVLCMFRRRTLGGERMGKLDDDGWNVLMDTVIISECTRFCPIVENERRWRMTGESYKYVSRT